MCGSIRVKFRTEPCVANRVERCSLCGEQLAEIEEERPAGMQRLSESEEVVLLCSQRLLRVGEDQQGPLEVSAKVVLLLVEARVHDAAERM